MDYLFPNYLGAYVSLKDMRFANVSDTKQKAIFPVPQTNHRVPGEQERGVALFGSGQLRKYQTHLWTREKKVEVIHSHTAGVEI